MHEVYIADSIFLCVCEALPNNIPAQSVRSIRIEVGKLDAIVPETLVFAFDAIKRIHNMPYASLDIEDIPVKCHCGGCGADFEIEAPLFICPECGGGKLEVLQGRGIRLTRIITDDYPGEDDGNQSGS